VNRWLLNSFPTWQLALLMVGGLVVLALFGLFLVRRAFPHLARGDANDVAGIAVGLLAAVYGIVLAFVIVAMYDDFKQAEAIVGKEATDVTQLYTDVDAFPHPLRDELKHAVLAYVTSVQGAEWNAMRNGHEAPGPESELRRITHLLQGFEPTTPSNSAFYSEAIGKLNDVVADRAERVQAARESLPGTFQVLVVGGALLLIGSLYFVGIPSARGQTLLVGGVAGLIGLNLLLALLLDLPFSGQLNVSNSPFDEVTHIVGRPGAAR
jgi:hypothetical protein